MLSCLKEVSFRFYAVLECYLWLSCLHCFISSQLQIQFKYKIKGKFNPIFIGLQINFLYLILNISMRMGKFLNLRFFVPCFSRLSPVSHSSDLLFCDYTVLLFCDSVIFITFSWPNGNRFFPFFHRWFWIVPVLLFLIHSTVPNTRYASIWFF